MRSVLVSCTRYEEHLKAELDYPVAYLPYQDGSGLQRADKASTFQVDLTTAKGIIRTIHLLNLTAI